MFYAVRFFLATGIFDINVDSQEEAEYLVEDFCLGYFGQRFATVRCSSGSAAKPLPEGFTAYTDLPGPVYQKLICGCIMGFDDGRWFVDVNCEAEDCVDPHIALNHPTCFEVGPRYTYLHAQRIELN